MVDISSIFNSADYIPVDDGAFAPDDDGFVSAIDELRTLDQWVGWKIVMRPDKDGVLHPTKPPVNPHNGRGASHSQPKDWSSYAQAAAAVPRYRLAGVGFVLSEDDGYTGVDLDKCRDAKTGQIEPWAQELVNFAETYAEVSPSGTGIRMIVRGKIAATIKCDPAHVKLYRSQRYLTITGDHIDGAPEDIRPAPKTLAALIARAEAIKPKREEPPAADPQPRQSGGAARPGSAPPSTGDSFFRAVNDKALANLESWVSALFPRARRQPGTGGWRVSSRDLGRRLQEDLSITSTGAVDFGVADMGDAREGRRTAIDLVMEHGSAPDAIGAALWLCERLGVDPEALGWQDDAETIAIGDKIAEAIIARNAEREAINEDDESEDDDSLQHGGAIHTESADDYADDILARHGLVPEIAQWILSISRRPQKRLAISSALAIVATAASRQFTTPTHSHIHLFVVMIAPSGGGKDAPMKAASELLSQSKLSEMLGPSGFSSDAGIYDKLYSQPICLALLNEFGADIAASTARQAPAHLQKILAAYRKFYDGGTFAQPHAVVRNSRALYNPCLTILGASTPQQFYSALTGAQAEDGFLNRFVAISAPGNVQKSDTALSPFDVPAHLIDWLYQLAERPGGINPSAFRMSMDITQHTPAPHAVAWTEEAKQRWNDYEDEITARICANPMLESFAPRCALNALRIATVLAIGESFEGPMIEAEHIELGKAIVEASLRDMVRGFDDHAAGTAESQLGDRVKRKLAENGGSLSRRLLFRALQRQLKNTRHLEDVLRILIEAREIRAESQPRKTGGKPTVVYKLRRSNCRAR